MGSQVEYEFVSKTEYQSSMAVVYCYSFVVGLKSE